MSEIICAFCEGKGNDPFELLSKNANCQVCGRKGRVEVEEPYIECLFCEGSGVYPCGTRITCTVCGGKGKVTIKGLTEECPECKGIARNINSGLSCSKCRGKGLVAKK